jgi:ammonia channel protein AmtB
MLEAGLTQAKNAVNIMMKNMMDFSIGSLAFFLVGFGIMFGSTSNGWCGSTLFALEGDASLASPEARLVWRGQGTEESIDVVRLANYHRRRSSPAPATWKSRSTSFTGARS